MAGGPVGDVRERKGGRARILEIRRIATVFSRMGGSRPSGLVKQETFSQDFDTPIVFDPIGTDFLDEDEP
ncbi:hypothetical protein MMC22_002783, partial [Lobaria immixta]|nr:hypothetical protein [Lobaria immixta]